MYKRLLIVLLAIGTGLMPAAASGSSLNGVCMDVMQSLSGQLELESITIDWSTDEEDSGLDKYVIKRYDCAEPSTCYVAVAAISARGTYGINEDYSYTDSPSEPLDSWTYTLEAWKTDGKKACTVDVQPE